MRTRTRAAVLVAAIIAIVGAPAGPASAHGGHNGRGGHVDQNKDFDVEVNRTSVSWTIADGQCSLLPAGTVITGTGTLLDKVTTRNRRDGTMSITFDDHASGTATDQNGNVYEWRYDNDLKQANTIANPNFYTGRMTDSFRLRGGGPLHLSNGFVANIEEDRTAGTFVINPLSSYGDPFNFPNGPNRCDPL